MADDVFDLTDATIRDEPYVTVRRIAPRYGSACRYEKIFKRDVEHGYGDFTPWAERENYFLQWFALHNVEHVVRPAQINFLPTRDIASVVTYDAGITLADWLRVQPRYPDGTTLDHPFQHAGAFLQLVRGCLAALKAIHRYGIAHCDIREDNICLQHVPHPLGQQAVRLDFDRVTLIDFAYSICPERALEQALPIDPGTPYLSEPFRNALREDRRAGSGRAVQALDYRVDLFALGCMGERIIEEGALAALRPGSRYVVQAGIEIVRRLKALGEKSKDAANAPLPHARLIAEIDSWLAKTGDPEDGLAFEVFRQRTNDELKAAGAGIRETPMTRIATPMVVSAHRSAASSSVAQRAGKIAKLVSAAAVLAGMGLTVAQDSAVSEMRPSPRASDASALHALAPRETDSPAVGAVGPQRVSHAAIESAEGVAPHLRSDDDELFMAGLRELIRLASEDAAGAADLLDRVIADYRNVLYSEATAADRVRALRRLRMAERAGNETAAQAIDAFEKSYDDLKKRILASMWWLRGEGAPPKNAEHWIESGFVLAAEGDRPAKLDQAFALAHGRALEQDRAKSIELYLQVIESSKAGDAFSTQLRYAGSRGLAATLNTVVKQKDSAAATRLEPLIAQRAAAGASDMQYYLGLFSECVRQPADLGEAQKWYSRAAADANWKSTAERKLQVLGKWCPSERG